MIEEGLYVNEAIADVEFKSRRRAEYLDRCIYVCPECGFARFTAKKNELICDSCQRTVTYHEDKTLSGNGFQLPFTFVNDWYEYQKSYVNGYDPSRYLDAPVFRDAASLYEVEIYHKKHLLRKTCSVSLYGDRITVDEAEKDPLVFPFDEVTTVAVLGRNKANIYINQTVYQLKGDKHFNALKYVNLYYRYQNIKKGDKNGEFLGL